MICRTINNSPYIVLKLRMEQKKVHKNAISFLNAALDVFSYTDLAARVWTKIAQIVEMTAELLYENKEALYVEVLTTVLQNGLRFPLQML